MRRVTLSLDESLADQFDELVTRHQYQNRSEAFRDLLRERLERERITTFGPLHCVAALTYVYNHHERQLASRLTSKQHEHHDICISSLHVHLDHDNCLETVVLRGALDQVKDFANSVTSETAVRHGNLHVVPVDVDSTPGKRHLHLHAHPTT